MTARIVASAFALPIVAATIFFASFAGATDMSLGSAVYKCKGPSGAVSYQDYPCKGGTVVDIRPDAVDPAAVERLQRANADFDRAAAARNTAEEMAALRREELNRRRLEVEAAQSMAESAVNPTYGPVYGFYGPYVKNRPNRPNTHRRTEHQPVVPEGRVPAVIHRPHPS